MTTPDSFERWRQAFVAGKAQGLGETIQIPTAQFLELADDGLIIQERRYFDSATLLDQLGV